MRTDNAVGVWPDDALKNFIFYIFSMYEFSHSLGHTLPSQPAPKSNNVRYGLKATILLQRTTAPGDMRDHDGFCLALRERAINESLRPAHCER